MCQKHTSLASESFLKPFFFLARWIREINSKGSGNFPSVAASFLPVSSPACGCSCFGDTWPHWVLWTCQLEHLPTFLPWICKVNCAGLFVYLFILIVSPFCVLSPSLASHLTQNRPLWLHALWSKIDFGYFPCRGGEQRWEALLGLFGNGAAVHLVKLALMPGMANKSPLKENLQRVASGLHQTSLDANVLEYQPQFITGLVNDAAWAEITWHKNKVS